MSSQILHNVKVNRKIWQAFAFWDIVLLWKLVFSYKVIHFISMQPNN